jgi:adenosylcobinamide-GDP ribazoletransferase
MLWGRSRPSGFLLATTLLTAIPLNVTPPRGSAPPLNVTPPGGSAPPLNVTPPGGSAPPLNVTPPGGSAPSRRAAGAAMIWAPVVGLLLGALAAAVLELASRFGHTGPLLAAALAVATLAAGSRGLHLDGLADLADGLGSRRPAGQALEIMKRSDIGPFGVVTLVFALLIQVAALAQAQSLGRGVAAAIAAAVAGRLSLTWACRRGIPAARGSGLGAMVAGTVNPAVPAAVTIAVLAGTAAFWPVIAVAIAAGLAASVVVTAWAVRRLGGITGDVLGALVEITVTVCLVVTAVRV